MDRDSATGFSSRLGRRHFLRTAAVTSALGLAGCSGLPGTSNEETETPPPSPGQLGSGRAGRPEPGGTKMTEMPPLSGTLTVYSGRGEFLVGELVSYLRTLYPDLELRMRYAPSVDLVNQILQEGNSSRADVFFSVNAGALGALADNERTTALSSDVLDLVRPEFRDSNGHWIGTSGRARTIPFNTETFDDADMPNDIFAYAEDPRFEDQMGWAPAYGSFQAFVTAMRLLEGESRTREWLEGMLDQGVQEYSDEFLVSQAVADGEIAAGFANHYYIQRLLEGRPNAPISTAFTANDAGAIFNVAGASVVDTASDPDMAENFVRHLLSAEAQEYFATTTFEYPLIPQVDPVGALPSINELDPPAGLDLTQLSDLGPTIRLLRDVGINV